MQPFCSIIIPSYLGPYPSAAKDRDKKIIRAIDSVLNQSFDNWELIIIADGCEKTVEIVKEHLQDKNINISLYLVPKQRLWCGVRNFGIDKATGQYIIYLDIDDEYCTDYLMNLSEEITDKDWYFLNDYKLKGNEFKVDSCTIQLGNCGTSNIIHKREMKARWTKSDYGEDYQFIKALAKESSNFERLNTVGYKVCHVPGGWDV